jgi:HSP20 family molecular chaperone IbpA
MLRRFNPFEDFSSIFRGFDNLLQQALEVDDVDEAAPARLAALAAPHLPATRLTAFAGRTYPAVETLRRGNQIILRAELPGMSLADLDISVVDNQLLLRGEKRAVREQDDSPTYFREISYGRFERAFTLPQGVKPEQVSARYENGVLEITLPAKALEDASRKVPIQIGAGAHRSAPATGCDRPSVAPARARGPRHQAG